jgi:hypothetical protein
MTESKRGLVFVVVFFAAMGVSLWFYWPLIEHQWQILTARVVEEEPMEQSENKDFDLIRKYYKLAIDYKSGPVPATDFAMFVSGWEAYDKWLDEEGPLREWYRCKVEDLLRDWAKAEHKKRHEASYENPTAEAVKTATKEAKVDNWYNLGFKEGRKEERERCKRAIRRMYHDEIGVGETLCAAIDQEGEG